jgi:predicted lipid-binding transport protein (Tim44 family)
MSNDIFLYPVPAFSNPNDICLRILTSAQARAVGGGFRHDPEELERRLKKQRGFNRQEFEELNKAEIAVADKADTVKNAQQREALTKAADAAREAYEEIARAASHKADVDALTHALNAAASASKARESIQQATVAHALAMHMVDELRRNDEQDEEEVIMMLLS